MMGIRSESTIGKEVFIGIDVHKRTYALAVKTSTGPIKKLSMPSNPEGLFAYIEKNFAGNQVHTAYEAGFSGFGLHRFLEKRGIRNLVVNAASIPIASNDRVKTDKRDAVKICELISKQMIKGIQIPSEKQETLRLHTRTREQLVKERTRIGIQIKSKLMYYGKISGTDKRKMSFKLLKDIIANWNLEPDLKKILGSLSTIYRCLHTEIRKLTLDIKAMSESEPLHSLYRSVPGVGPISAAVMMAELNDMKQFKNERTVFSFTGLTPAEFSSGDHTRRGHISRQGSARLRAVLVEVAWRAIKKDKFLKASYE